MHHTYSLKSAELSPEDRDELRAYLECLPREMPLLTAEQEATATQDELVEHNIRLSITLACQYAGRGVPVSDLIQEGNIGLMRAAQTFDPARGRFSTYATRGIADHIRRAISNQGNVIRIPTHIAERRPDTATHETRRKAEASRKVISLSAAMRNHDWAGAETNKAGLPLAFESELADPHADTEAQALGPAIEAESGAERRALIRSILDSLPEAERQAVELCLVQRKTLREAAPLCGCSYQTVSNRIEAARRRAIATHQEAAHGLFN